MPTAAIPNGLNQFQNLLIGTWNNQPLPNATNGEGGTGNPLSYNVMPLPRCFPRPPVLTRALIRPCSTSRITTKTRCQPLRPIPTSRFRQRLLRSIRTSTSIWNVSTGNQGQTINIPFEQRAANVTGYTASYWLLSNDGGASYKYLAYTQNISMQFTINGTHYNFPHVTSNVVTKA